jgi:hypothetical protein
MRPHVLIRVSCSSGRIQEPLVGHGCLFTFFLIRRPPSISLTRAQGTPRYKIGSLRGVFLSAYNKKHHNYTSMGPLYASAADHPDRALLLLCQVDARVDVGVQGPGPGTLRTMPLRRGGDVEVAGTQSPGQVWASLRVLLTTRTTQTTSSFRVRPFGSHALYCAFLTAPAPLQPTPQLSMAPPCNPHHSIACLPPSPPAGRKLAVHRQLLMSPSLTPACRQLQELGPCHRCSACAGARGHDLLPPRVGG